VSIRSALNQNALSTVIGSVLFFSVTGYIQYRAARDLRAEAIIAKRTGKLRGYFLGLAGIIAFAALLQILYVLSILGVDLPRWGGLLVCLTIGLIVVGFLVGNRIVGKVRKRRKL
jgi:hypothetical protein